MTKLEKQCQAFQNFLKAQVKSIETAKWYEGERRHQDPGDEFCVDWITSNAPVFRKQWEESRCCKCFNADKCGHKLVKRCKEFKKL